MIVGALRLPLVTLGIMEESTTRNPSTPHWRGGKRGGNSRVGALKYLLGNVYTVG